MSLSKTSKKKIVKLLWEAFDRLEGEYSNIPQCCIEEYINGRTYHQFALTLTNKQLKKLHAWHYVPCDKCFEKGNKKDLVKGTSIRGSAILLVLESLGCYGR